MCDKMAISAYILKIVEKDPFLRLQMRAKEMFKCLINLLFRSDSTLQMFHFTVTFMKFEILYHQLAIFLDLQ